MARFLHKEAGFWLFFIQGAGCDGGPMTIDNPKPCDGSSSSDGLPIFMFHYRYAHLSNHLHKIAVVAGFGAVVFYVLSMVVASPVCGVRDGVLRLPFRMTVFSAWLILILQK